MCEGQLRLEAVARVWRGAYRSVLMDSSRLESAGDMQLIMTVAELPPRELCSSLVSFESRYGTCCDLET